MIRDVVRYSPPSKWGVLCIDCWDDDGSNDPFYFNALEKLKSYPISVSINCATDLKIDYQDQTVYNTLKQYLWEPYSDNVQINNRALLELVTSAGTQETSRVLRQNLFDQDTVCLYSRETFIQHIQFRHPDVYDWILLGSAWGYCLHRGPLGVDKVVDISDRKFYMFPEWSIQTEDRQTPEIQQIHDDFFVWAPIDDNGYRLITRAQNHKWIETT